MRLKPAIQFSFLVLLAACTTNAKPDLVRPNLTRVDIAPGVTLTLPERPPFGRNGNAVQVVEAKYRDHMEVFQAAIESDSQHMTVVVTMPTGPRVMSIEWRAGNVTTKLAPIAPKGLAGEHMLADMMLIYAEPAVLKAAVAGATVTLKPDGSRSITKNGRELIRVSRTSGGLSNNPWDGRAMLENLAFDYILKINSHPNAP